MEIALKKLKKLMVVGMVIETSNESTTDIPNFWSSFFSNSSIDLIKNRVNQKLIAVYFDYQGDNTKPFKVLIGAEVSKVEGLSSNMLKLEIPAQSYRHRNLREGKFPDKIIDAWKDVWLTKEARSYSFDLEVYDYTTNPLNPDIDLYIAANV
jgi:predicted transcriptional regulator YdeE